MEERTYVKLTKEEGELHIVVPGELNQPIDIAKLNGPKCSECGQTLPPTYQPPADEDWTTEIFGCAEDIDSCMTGLFCPCVLFGRNVEIMRDDISSAGACLCHGVCVEGGMALAALTAVFHGIDPDTAFLITEGLLFAWWMCGIYTSTARQYLQRNYHLKDSPCDPCMVHCCLHWCALCQEHREMKNRISSDNSVDLPTNPPPVQEMNAIETHNPESSSSSSS